MSNSLITNAYLIGFCSIPFRGQNEFVKEDITEAFFSTYKDELKKNSKLYSGKESDKYEGLYNPDLYYLWGKYDLCIFSRIDDLEFPTRFFRYSDTSHGQDGKAKIQGEMQNFDYRVIVGIETLNKDRAAPMQIKPLPYIAITQLKLNSAFLIGNGFKFIELVKDKISEIIKRTCDSFDNESLLFVDVVCETYSYHELVAVIKSNSIHWLKNVVLAIRKIKFSELVCDPKMRKEIIDNSLFKKIIDEKEPLNEIHNHIFESTLTTFGVHFNLLSDVSQFQDQIEHPISNEEITLISRWNIKPGHTKRVLDLIKKIDETSGIAQSSIEDRKFLVAGKGDLIIQRTIKIANNGSLDFPEYYFRGLPFLTDASKENRDKKDHLWHHVNETYTTIGFELISGTELSSFFDFNMADHHETHKNLNRFAVNADTLCIKEKLKSLWVPTILAEKILRLISNYNNAILNADMYVFYLELLPHIIDNFIKTIDAFSINDGNELYPLYKLNNILEKASFELEMAFLNRFYQSYWTSEIPEVNTDYSGGIHNLISIHDSCFKALSNILSGKNKHTAFIYVKSDSKIQTQYESLRLNYTLLIQPYIFCSVVVHESLNYALEKYCFANQKSGPNSGWSLLSGRLIRLLISADIELNGPFLYPYKNDILNKKGAIFNTIEFKSKDNPQLNSIYKFNELINSITLRYFITDFLNFEISYMGDFDLFKDTSWNHFFQTGYNFDSPANLNEVYFLTLSIRMALIKINIANDHISFDEFLKIFPNNTWTEDLVKKFGSDLYGYMNWLLSLADFENWFKDCKSVLKEIVGSKHLSEIDHDHLLKKFDWFLNEDASTLEGIIEFIDNELKKGTDFSIIYLSIVNSCLRKYTPELNVLRRDAKGKPFIELNQALYIDPTGGTFCVGQKERANYLSHRVKFYKLLSHLSNVYKPEYIFHYYDRNILKNSDSK